MFAADVCLGTIKLMLNLTVCLVWRIVMFVPLGIIVCFVMISTFFTREGVSRKLILSFSCMESIFKITYCASAGKDAANVPTAPSA